jgi:hypothetical protein
VLFTSLTLCHICLFGFIQVEGQVKLMKHFGGEGTSFKSLGTSGVENYSKTIEII